MSSSKKKLTRQTFGLENRKKKQPIVLLDNRWIFTNGRKNIIEICYTNYKYIL
jgi:hypothetical protein